MNLAVIPICMMLGCLLLGCSSARDRAEREASKTIGDEIVKALETYKAKTGSYPEELTNLVEAGILAKIEPPVWGRREWGYLREEYRGKETFYLSVRKTEKWYPVLVYHMDGWDYDDGGF